MTNQQCPQGGPLPEPRFPVPQEATRIRGAVWTWADARAARTRMVEQSRAPRLGWDSGRAPAILHTESLGKVALGEPQCHQKTASIPPTLQPLPED